VAYVLTGVFGVALMVLASKALYGSGFFISGSKGVIEMATMLERFLGRLGYWTFVFGFWGAVITSLLGVWQSVPYLFCDFIGLVKNLPAEEHQKIISTRSKWYRGYLIYLGITPMALLFLQKPVGIIVLYSVIGALFMPFLAGTLLFMNSKQSWVGELRNGWATKCLLIVALILFGFLCFQGVLGAFGKF